MASQVFFVTKNATHHVGHGFVIEFISKEGKDCGGANRNMRIFQIVAHLHLVLLLEVFLKNIYITFKLCRFKFEISSKQTKGNLSFVRLEVC